jgi:hypothetical protein
MQDPLSQLRDLHLPAPPPWWPPAPGWWLLGALGIAAIILAVWLLRRRYARGAPRRFALAQFDTLLAAYRGGRLTPIAYVDATNRVLKRLLIASGHQQAAPLSGSAWLGYLDGLSETTTFSRGPGTVLGSVRYQPNPDLDAAGLHAALVNIPARLANGAPTAGGG